MDAGYSRQYAQRQPVVPRKPKMVKNPPKKTCLKAGTTLLDALKQHGMRLCDGARLNAVGKGVETLGQLPASLAAPVTALYLSQNNLRSLEGVEQFTSVRLLSVGGNLIASDAEVARLTQLKQLRNLNFTGNALCDQPNYRLRVVAALKQLQVLDNCDVTKKEREAAPQVAAQDEAMRSMVTQNHFAIQKLQRIEKLILLHKEFYGRVMAGVVTGRFDRVPSPSDVACNVPMLLKLWRYEDALSKKERETLQVQMLTIVVRTYAKLAEHPKVKAKEYLLKLANGSSPRAQHSSNNAKQRCASWEEAYNNVIVLQHKTMANLQALCERNRAEMVEFLKNLLSLDPRQRARVAGCPLTQARADLETKQPPRARAKLQQPWTGSQLAEVERSRVSSDGRFVQHKLLPQQQDPDVWDQEHGSAARNIVPASPAFIVRSTETRSPRHAAPIQDAVAKHSTPDEAPKQKAKDRKSTLRSGEFANKSLGEAIHTFTLRESTAVQPSQPVRLVPPPSKIPQVQCAYPMARRDTLPLPPELVVKQLPPFPGHTTTNQRPPMFPAQFSSAARDLGRSHRDSQVSTNFSYSERRVSSAFTREDLDMTNISEISCQSPPSPQRESCIEEEAYIPIERSSRSSPSPRTDQLPQAAQSNAGIGSSPQEQSATPTTGTDSRLQELEQREEKYIRALMQSEQRELDLRNNLSSVQRKLASYQRTLAQQLHEREAIKEEVAQRTMAMAAPRVLKRFFIRWIRFYNWSQQVQHIRRKRRFIVQHDVFWQWRRKVWLQQELRSCLRMQQHRLCWSHFNEWVNVTRVSVIAKRAKALNERRFLHGIFRAWVDGVAAVKGTKKLQRERSIGAIRTMQRACFREWKRITRYKKTLRKVQDLRWEESLRTSQQLVFWSWKLYLFSVARPLQERAARFQQRIESKRRRQHFHEWRKLVQVDRMHDAHLRRRVWQRWVTWRRRIQEERNAEHKANNAIAKVFFGAWHITAAEQATSRRSLNLAKRYVNRRRLRKLWVHWKYFSMARRKYTQDSTKALKHYFVKLLRSSWKHWKERTHSNLQKVRANKYGTLQRHFNAFQTGIRLSKTEKVRSRLISHASKRKQWTRLRRLFQGWRMYTAKKKRAKRNAHVVSLQWKQWTLDAAWRQWRTLHVDSLRRQMGLLRKTYDTILKEKHELEAHLQAAKAKNVSLSDQIEDLRESSERKEAQVIDLQHRLHLSEERAVALEGDLKNARSAVELERHDWEDALSEEEQRRENEALKYRSLAQDNQVLQVELMDVKRELEAEKTKVVEARQSGEEVRSAMEGVYQSHRSEMVLELEKRKELEQEIVTLRGHLEELDTERKDTANRLQEYEKRIADTCEAMNEHERAHEQENERLRSDYCSLEAKLKEEQVRSAELNRLVQEKNVQLLDMTHQLKIGGCTSRSSHPGHENCTAAQSKREESEPLESSKPCTRHPETKALTTPMKRRASEMNAMLQSHQVPRQPSYQVSSGQLSHAVTAHPMRAVASAEEMMIDEHTSKVHDDIRLLQARISRRLEQAPAIAQLPPRLLQRPRIPFSTAQKSPQPCTSDEESDSTVEHQSIPDRVRRARLRRLQSQKAAVITSVSPVISRLASNPSLLSKDRENSSFSANVKKRLARNGASARVPTGNDRPAKKKVAKRQSTVLVRRAERML